MALTNARAPKGGVEIVREAVAAALASDAETYAALAEEGLSIAPPHPVYSLTRGAVRNGVLLDAAVFEGWRYLVFGGEGEGGGAVAAVVVAGEPGDLRFHSLNAGRLVTRSVAGIAAAEALEAVAGADYELRYIEAPAFCFAAIWLGGGGDGEFDLILPLDDQPLADLRAYTPIGESAALHLLQAQVDHAGGAVEPEGG